MLARVASALSSPGEERVVPNEDEDSSDNDSYEIFEEETFIEETIRLIKEFFRYDNLKKEMKKLLEEYKITITISHEDLSMAMTIFVLFASNIKDLSATKDVDDGFYTATAVCLFYFIAEFVGGTWSKTSIKTFYPKFVWDGYLFSFFWWLDLLAIISLFFDVPFVASALHFDRISTGKSSSAQKGARVVRLVRLVRLIKLQKVASEKKNRMKREKYLMELVRRGVVDYDTEKGKMDLNEYRQSKLGTQLTDAITKKVIILVLIMVILLPFLEYTSINKYTEFSFNYLHSVNANLTMNSTLKEHALNGFLSTVIQDPEDPSNSYPYLLHLEMSPTYNSTLVHNAYQLDYVRVGNQLMFDKSEYVGGVHVYTKAIFSLQYSFRLTALYEILLTIFIGFLLVAGSVILTGDAQRILLTPIERMMNMVEAVARDPLTKLEFDNDGKAAYETRLLENTIEKITGLLRVGFGEAGAGIISANLQSAAGTSVNPLLPGVRVYCIVGFCDIHQYEYVSNVLSNDILVFTNTIAEIVHTSVQYWGGQCNKNLGNAFVIIWRIGDEETIAEMTASNFTRGQSNGRLIQQPNDSSRNQATNSSPSKASDSSRKKKAAIDLKRVPGVDAMADKALIGYLKIIAEINRSKGVLAYRNEPRLTGDGSKEFKVRMGFGLHAGWAIEGAVGSKQKVDATYLSPHVNMAARLETSSRQYGVPLLASHFFTELMTPECFMYLRKVDIVTVKGSEVPIEIFTYDSLQEQTFTERLMARKPSVSEMDSSGSEIDSGKGASPEPSSPTAPPSDSDPSSPSGSMSEFRKGMSMRVQAKSPFCVNTDETDEIFERDADLTQLRAHVSPEFLATFKSGIGMYLEGDWSSGRQHLEKADKMMAELAPALGGDGPCRTLLDYMEERDWKAPEDWKGFRPLTSK